MCAVDHLRSCARDAVHPCYKLTDPADCQVPIRAGEVTSSTNRARRTAWRNSGQSTHQEKCHGEGPCLQRKPAILAYARAGRASNRATSDQIAREAGHGSYASAGELRHGSRSVRGCRHFVASAMSRPSGHPQYTCLPAVSEA